MHEPKVLNADSASKAWRAMFEYVANENNPGTTVLQINAQDSIQIERRSEFEAWMDEKLGRFGKQSVNQTAATIFPYRMWVRRGRPGHEDFTRLCVESFYPRFARRSSLNKYGIYANRLMTNASNSVIFDRSQSQLCNVITAMQRAKSPRESYLQLAVYNPSLDHRNPVRRGFPCLQQISITRVDVKCFSLHALYPTQFIFDRAAGNYLGLQGLGDFIAFNTQWQLKSVVLHVISPKLGQSLRKNEKQAMLNELSQF